jgi:hypothetical protein
VIRLIAIPVYEAQLDLGWSKQEDWQIFASHTFRKNRLIAGIENPQRASHLSEFTLSGLLT